MRWGVETLTSHRPVIRSLDRKEGPMASLRKKGDHWYIRFRDETGKQTERKASRDKAVAKSMMAKLEERLRGIRLGTLDAREADCNEAQQIPIADHARDFISNLAARGCVPEHVDGIRKRLTWLLDQTKITRLSQLRPSLALGAMKALRDAKRSERTLAHYVAAWKGFSRWCKRDRRTKEDFLDELERPAVPKTEGAALTTDQASRLISSTRAGKARRGLSGEARSWLYALALSTGWRRGELQALKPESFDLDASPPRVSLKGHIAGELTKNRKAAVQPLPDYIVPELRSWLAGKPAGMPIFPHDRNSSLMIKADLKAAGIPADEFTFHSLRHTYLSKVNATGADRKTTMELARHSDPRLTFGTYVHTRLEEMGRVVNSLPPLWDIGGKRDCLSLDRKSKTATEVAIREDSDRRGKGEPLSVFSHAHPTPGVSTGPNGTSGSHVKQSPETSQHDPSRHVFKLPGQDSNLEKQDQNLL